MQNENFFLIISQNIVRTIKIYFYADMKNELFFWLLQSTFSCHHTTHFVKFITFIGRKSLLYKITSKSKIQKRAIYVLSFEFQKVLDVFFDMNSCNGCYVIYNNHVFMFQGISFWNFDKSWIKHIVDDYDIDSTPNIIRFQIINNSSNCKYSTKSY